MTVLRFEVDVTAPTVDVVARCLGVAMTYILSEAYHQGVVDTVLPLVSAAGRLGGNARCLPGLSYAVRSRLGREAVEVLERALRLAQQLDTVPNGMPADIAGEGD